MAIPFDQLQEAASSGRRSKLYRYLLKNHEEVQKALTEAGRPNWQALAEAFAAAELWDIKNRPPTAEVARQTWIRVKKVIAAKSPARPTTQPEPQSPSMPPPPPADDEPEFRTITGEKIGRKK